VERAYPLVASELQTLSRTLASAEASIRLEITRQQRSTAAALAELREQRRLLEGVDQSVSRRLYINHWSHERIQEAESRLATAGLALPLITGESGPAVAPPLAPASSAEEPPLYTMVRAHATVTDL